MNPIEGRLEHGGARAGMGLHYFFGSATGVNNRS